ILELILPVEIITGIFLFTNFIAFKFSSLICNFAL
ncbi:putative membrane protein, partial [Chlamydia psittaci 02DC14]